MAGTMVQWEPRSVATDTGTRLHEDSHSRWLMKRLLFVCLHGRGDTHLVAEPVDALQDDRLPVDAHEAGACTGWRAQLGKTDSAEHSVWRRIPKAHVCHPLSRVETEAGSDVGGLAQTAAYSTRVFLRMVTQR